MRPGIKDQGSDIKARSETSKERDLSTLTMEIPMCVKMTSERNTY